MKISFAVVFVLIIRSSRTEGAAESEEFNDSVQNEEVLRNGSLFWSEFNHPTTNIIMQVAASFFGANTKDFFHFLRDSYSLPEGKFSLHNNTSYYT